MSYSLSNGGILIPQGSGGGESGFPAPSVPDGFHRDLKAYADRTGHQYRCKWNRKQGYWVIQIREANGNWNSILAVYDHDAFEAGEGLTFRELDRRVIDELYEADITNRCRTGNVDWDIRKEHLARIEAAKMRKERSRDEAGRIIADASADANLLWRRVKHEFDYGHGHGAKGLWQVPGQVG